MLIGNWSGHLLNPPKGQQGNGFTASFSQDGKTVYLIDDDATLTSVMDSDVVTTSPDSTLVDVLKLMVDEQVSHLPVVDDDNLLIGICTRTDVLRARGQEFALERLDKGWLAPVLQRSGSTGPRFVIVGNRTLGNTELDRVISERAGEVGSTRFHVVVPMQHSDDLVDVRARLEEQLERIEVLGGRATGEVTDGDALVAIESAVKVEGTEGVILCTLPAGKSRWLRADLATRAESQLSVPVTHLVSDIPG